MVWLVVGLGNPGARYETTRHNVGARVVEQLAHDWSVGAFRSKFKGLIAKTTVGTHEVVLLLPQTYMNKSGESVQAAGQFFKTPLENLVVIHDELDLPFQTIRVKLGGGTAGHGGLGSISAQCGGSTYTRVRIGIGRPPQGVAGAHYVLENFRKDEEEPLREMLTRGAAIVKTIVEHGVEKAMNQWNGS